MIVTCAVYLCALLPHPRCKINLTADDRMNILCLGLLVEPNRAVHDAMVGHSNRIHPEFLRAPHELLDAARTIQQTVLCMYMQVGKRHRFPPFRLGSPLLMYGRM